MKTLQISEGVKRTCFDGV